MNVTYIYVDIQLLLPCNCYFAAYLSFLIHTHALKSTGAIIRPRTLSVGKSDGAIKTEALSVLRLLAKWQ